MNLDSSIRMAGVDVEQPDVLHDLSSDFSSQEINGWGVEDRSRLGFLVGDAMRN